ncbi:MAG: VacB/RNase II family 3'-5' exoribonuclease [Clostridia bacterium]|nr:VacB/RNase II family 3'-5' exoribonuclease [Clostridia bacterium]
MKQYGKNKKKLLKKIGRRQEEKKRARRAYPPAEVELLGVEDCRTPAEKKKFARAAALARHAGGQHSRPATKKQIVEGVFHGTSRGFGFVTPEGQGDDRARDIFIPAAATGGALDGDRVRVRYHAYTSYRTGEAEEKTEGEVLTVLSATHRTVIGTLMRGEGGYGRRAYAFWYLQPDDSRLPDEITLPGPGQAREGDKVEVELEKNSTRGLRGRVVRVFGPAGDRAANYEAVLAAQEIRTVFPAAVVAEAEEKAARPLSAEGRVRREHEVIFTIDGAGAKDLDDAVSLRRLPHGGWQLGVHIADVSEYVTPGSALDSEAMLRGTSIYFIDKVVPMLPEALSNGACSLNAGEDKYALSAVMTLDEGGVIRSTQVTRSIIRSRVRGVYEEVNDLFEKGKASSYAKKYAPVQASLDRMRELYRALEKRNRARGALSLERPEPVILLDEHGEPAEIVSRERGEAERMIEQFMLTANEGVATLMQGKGYPCVYRVHDKPEAGRLADFVLYAHNLGLDTRPLQKEKEQLSGLDFAAVLDEASEKGIAGAVSYTLLRTMAKAEYSEKPTGHFGLGIRLYSHFTSPIRRLSDLATHRMVKAVLLDGEAGGRYASYAHRAAEAATEGELRALEAEREIEALYKTLYMRRHEGECFDAQISSITSFGLFAELENTCEGLLPLAALPGSFFFDEKNLSLRSSDTVLRIGDRIRIRVAEADVPTRRVRFTWENM